jgi:hypothetical protein
VHRRWAPVQVDAGEEQLLAGNVDVVEATDEADVSTGSGKSVGAVLRMMAARTKGATVLMASTSGPLRTPALWMTVEWAESIGVLQCRAADLLRHPRVRVGESRGMRALALIALDQQSGTIQLH